MLPTCRALVHLAYLRHDKIFVPQEVFAWIDRFHAVGSNAQFCLQRGATAASQPALR